MYSHAMCLIECNVQSGFAKPTAYSVLVKILKILLAKTPTTDLTCILDLPL